MRENTVKNECLAVEEILNFISTNKIDSETLALITRVNSHICKCNECLAQVKAFQTLENSFEKLFMTKTEEKKLDAEHPGF